MEVQRHSETSMGHPQRSEPWALATATLVAGACLIIATATVGGAAEAVPAAVSDGTEEATQGSSAVPLRAIDVYRTDAFDAEWVEARLGDDIRAVLRREGDDDRLAAVRERVLDTLHSRGDFAHLELSPIRYFGDEGSYAYLTVDVVDESDRAERMAFDEAPTEAFDDPDGLLAAWSEYQSQVTSLLMAGEVGAVPLDECPALHCLAPAFSHPLLEPYAERFGTDVPRRKDALVRILQRDGDPEHRAIAAFLLAHTEDADALAELLVDAIRDPASIVRNNAMRVLALMAAQESIGVRIPLEPVLAAIDFPAATDRNKALAILAGVVRHRPELRDRVVEKAGERLLALLRLQQPNNHEFAWEILKTVSGKEHGERDYRAWREWLAAFRGAQSSPLEDPTRPDSERERDPGSRPLEVYAWLGIEPGATVVDIMPFGGYNSHLLAHVVGPEGRVVAAYAFGQDHVDKLADRFRSAGLDNVVPTLGLDGIADSSVDVVLSVRNLHDMYIPSIEEQFGFAREEILRTIHRVLKPGGILGVVDARMPDEGVNDETHRINEEFAVTELEARGFELLERSELLAVPDDDYTEMGFPTRWKVDRFLLKLRCVQGPS